VKAVLLGATRGMGRAVARLLAERGDELFLLGRDPDELARSAADLQLRSGGPPVGTYPCDLMDAASIAPALERADQALNGFDTVVVTAGRFAPQEELEKDAALREEVLQTNFTGTIAFAEEARQRLLARGGGTLCVFSSIAGDRARKPVLLYGATKAGLTAYMHGLDHKFRGQGLRAVLVKPGFVHTDMTAELDPPPFAGEPEAVAKRVVRAIDRGWPVVYAPAIWRLIMLVIRHLPRSVMRRIGF
jgi:short-subunit dehydrogenase